MPSTSPTMTMPTATVSTGTFSTYGVAPAYSAPAYGSPPGKIVHVVERPQIVERQIVVQAPPPEVQHVKHVVYQHGARLSARARVCQTRIASVPPFAASRSDLVWSLTSGS